MIGAGRYVNESALLHRFLLIELCHSVARNRRNMSASEEEDDWFYDSIKRYRTLLMFDFITPIKFIELINLNTVCVIFKENNCVNEISYLSLPKKLTVALENEGLEKDSDFKVINGGFSQNVVAQMKPLFDTNTLLVSEEGQQGLNIYNTKDSGTINYSNTINCELNAPKISFNKIDQVALTATKKEGLILLDTGQLCVKDSVTLIDGGRDTEHLLQPEFISPNLLALCDNVTGITTTYDTRSMKVSTVVKRDEKHQNTFWTLSTSFLSTNYISDNLDDTKLGFLSATGIIFLYDIRNFQSPVCSEKQGGKISPSLQCLKPKLQFSPSSSSLISISGFDANINIFDYSSGEIKSIFIHDGHVRKCSENQNIVTDHVWYKNSVISACSNLSLHCWEHSM